MSPLEYKGIFDTFGTVKSIGDDVSVFIWKDAIQSVVRGAGELRFKFAPSKRLLLKRDRVHWKLNILVKGNVDYRTNMNMVEYRSIFKNNNDVDHIIPDPLTISVNAKAAKLKDV
ncbi:hypothetical protein PR048_021201 [Dryococelus australis]|uniref:Uncharacterized protein n=1 Tax=Dryococelus australis TaxID=614101 RepID=A0ABQ9GXJ7_9NEOP|nr:hypothetical protein PR048_021201 [Dryococelus australis]